MNRHFEFQAFLLALSASVAHAQSAGPSGPASPALAQPTTGLDFHAALDPFGTWTTLDPFGALRRGVEAAVDDLGASQEELHDALVNLGAEVVQCYVDLRALQARIAIAEQNLEAQAETARIASWRAQAGLTTALDVERADTAVSQTRSQRVTGTCSHTMQGTHTLQIFVGGHGGGHGSQQSPPRRP